MDESILQEKDLNVVKIEKPKIVKILIRLYFYYPIIYLFILSIIIFSSNLPSSMVLNKILHLLSDIGQILPLSFFSKEIFIFMIINLIGLVVYTKKSLSIIKVVDFIGVIATCIISLIFYGSGMYTFVFMNNRCGGLFDPCMGPIRLGSYSLSIFIFLFLNYKVVSKSLKYLIQKFT